MDLARKFKEVSRYPSTIRSWSLAGALHACTQRLKVDKRAQTTQQRLLRQTQQHLAPYDGGSKATTLRRDNFAAMIICAKIGGETTRPLPLKANGRAPCYQHFTCAKSPPGAGATWLYFRESHLVFDLLVNIRRCMDFDLQQGC